MCEVLKGKNRSGDSHAQRANACISSGLSKNQLITIGLLATWMIVRNVLYGTVEEEATAGLHLFSRTHEEATTELPLLSGKGTGPFPCLAPNTQERLLHVLSQAVLKGP